MSVFDPPEQDTALAARVAAVEQALETLGFTFSQDSEQKAAAIAVVAEQRAAGDEALTGSLTAEQQARQAALQGALDMIADERQERLAGDAINFGKADQAIADSAEARAAAQLAAQQAAAAAIATGTYFAAHATALPRGLSSIAIGGAAITGATPGTYALIPVGGSVSGIVASLVVDSATTARVTIDKPGLNQGGGTVAPTFVNPAGANLPAGTTLTASLAPLVPVAGAYWAPTADSLYLARWSNDGTATPAPVLSPDGSQVKMPVKAALDLMIASAQARLDEMRQVVDIATFNVPDHLAVFIDALGQVYGKVNLAAGWDILLTKLATAEGMEISSYEMVGDAPPVIFVDADGNILWQAPLPGAPEASVEIQAARGSRVTLNDRIGQALDPYGSPRDGFNANRLRQYHYRRRKRLLAVPEPVQNIVALFGDSFSHNITRYSGDLAATMIAEQGDGGGGWTGFGFNAAAATFTHGGTQPALMNGNVRATYGVSLNGAWDKAYATVPAPDTCCAISSSAGAEIRATFPAAPALSGAELFWIGTADGVMEYSWNGSSWTTINVQGTVGACSHAALTGFGAGAGTLYLRVVSGTCKPAGVNWKSTASGVVFHKLAATGSKMSQLAPQAATASWKTAVAALGITTAIVMHGTNDQGTAPIRSPDEFATDGETVMNNLVAAIPSIDRLWAMPPENQRTGMTFAMPLYKAAAAAKAAALGVAFLDHQRNFGDPANATEYGSAGATPLFNADLIHPEPATGGRALLDAFLRFLSAA